MLVASQFGKISKPEEDVLFILIAKIRFPPRGCET